MKPFASLLLAVPATILTGCGGCLGGLGGARTTEAVAAPSSSGVFGGSARSETCDPGRLANVGATWTYPGVNCPFGPDPQAIDACVMGGWAALIGAQGYPTLADAVNAAQPSDTVTICPGVHPDIFTARGITLQAADPRPDATVLDGGTDYWVVLGDAALRGVTLGSDRGVEVENAADAVLECLTVEDHFQFSKAVIAGSGSGGTITVRHSLFARGNTTVIGAMALLVVEDTAFLDNTPNNGSYGAVMIAQGVTLRRTAFIGNEQYRDYNTVMQVNPVGNGYASLIEDCWFEANVSGWDQGGDNIQVSADLTVRGTTFKDNTSAKASGCIRQPELGATLTVSDSTFVGNTSASDVAGGGGVLVSADRAIIERSRFEDNTIVLGNEPSVFSQGRGQWEGSDLVVHRNQGGEGALSTSSPNHVTCECCDFGAFNDDNQPGDAFVDGQPVPDLPLDFSL